MLWDPPVSTCHSSEIQYCGVTKGFFFYIAHALKHVGTSQLSGLEWKLEQIIAAFIGALVMLHPECSC